MIIPRQMQRYKLAKNHFSVGQRFYNLSLYAEAILEFKVVDVLSPKTPGLKVYIANCLVALDRYTEALPYLERLLAHNPEDPTLRINLSICHTSMSNFTLAKTLLMEGIRLEPDNADFYCSMGDTLTAEGYDEEAVRFYQDALDIDPKHCAALNNLASIIKDPLHALELSEQALKRMPDNLQILKNTWELCKKTGKRHRQCQIERRIDKVYWNIKTIPAINTLPF
jgi:tetratricopeptide (TPR) repeat protein